jgi:hypothetical protein
MTAGAAKPPPPPTPTPEVTGTIGHAAGFEDNDGNMAAKAGGDVNSADTSEINFDWNSFAPVTWHGSAPYQTTNDGDTPLISNGWQVLGLTDAQANTTDNGFAGGVKQDDDCAAVNGSKAPNKDDLKRFYIASKNVNGHIYLELAWVRIPQNTTSASAHVGFEFNQASADPTTGNPCGAASGGLVHRTTGDLLVIYDFTGGSTVPPTINVSRWVSSGACQVGADSAPCWGTFSQLDPCEAEANVDTGLSHTGVPNDSQTGCGRNELSSFSYQPPSSVPDSLAPSSDTLGASEFGEAGIDLTNVGIFTSGTCTTFGNVYAVSRSSGDSSTAAMEDVVGPGHFELSNCGEVKIIKHTDPRGTAQAPSPSFSYSSSISNPAAGSNSPSCSGDSTPASFTLSDAGTDSTSSNVEDCNNVQPGTYTVTETAASGYSLESLTCDPALSASNTTNGGKQHASGSLQADITVAAGGVVTCTFQNQPNQGAVAITKSATKIKACTGANTPAIGYGVCTGSGTGNLNGAHFKVCTNSGATAANCTTPTGITTNDFTTATDGTVCVDHLPFSSGGTTYYVVESSAPSGFKLDTTSTRSVSVTTNARCTDSSGKASVTFSDAPLTDLVVTATAQAHDANNANGATQSKITCATDDASFSSTVGTPVTTNSNPAEMDATGNNGLVPGTYFCKIIIDP